MTKHERAVLDAASKRMDLMLKTGRFGETDAELLKRFSHDNAIVVKLVKAVARWRIAAGKARTAGSATAGT